MSSDAQRVKEYLVGMGWVAQGAPVAVAPLSGGVSNDVWKIEGDGFRWVMKKALPKLKVEVDWYSDVERIEREQAAMLALEPMLPPGTVPKIVHRDSKEHVYVMTCAPKGAECWKDQMMAGRLETETALLAGRLLRKVHDESRARKDALQPDFDDLRFFDELRIDPFHRYLSARFPELEGAISELVDELTTGGECLVHGDYSPKNILVAPGKGGQGKELILLDYEVAHWGNPVFDQAYCCGHLMLKGWALGQRRQAAQMIDAFLQGYGGPRRGLVRHLGLMLLARIDGKSTVPYITDPRLKGTIRGVGREWVARCDLDPTEAVRAALAVDDKRD